MTITQTTQNNSSNNNNNNGNNSSTHNGKSISKCDKLGLPISSNEASKNTASGSGSFSACKTPTSGNSNICMIGFGFDLD